MLFSGVATAQSSGPSDITTPPPTTNTSVNQILCNGQNISITGPQDVNGADYTFYHWYKVDGNGNKILTSTTSKVYTENTTAAGYYNYQLITENSTGCTSDASDEYQVYVLPALLISINSSSTSVCSSTGSLLLTAEVPASTGYSVTYQWTRNGTNIPGAQSNTYNVNGETANATVTYGVIVSYALHPSCTANATIPITIIPIPTKPVITAS
ncbi:hypothetical protein [Mucilaginibacter sp.]